MTASDIGVVFDLSGGSAGLAKAGHHDEAMFVTFADIVDALDVPDRSIEWDWTNELDEEY